MSKNSILIRLTLLMHARAACQYLSVNVVTNADVCLECRQAVPLTLALLNVSSPNLNAVDTLSRLSHDTDIHVAQNAVLALGTSPHLLLCFTSCTKDNQCLETLLEELHTALHN